MQLGISAAPIGPRHAVLPKAKFKICDVGQAHRHLLFAHLIVEYLSLSTLPICHRLLNTFWDIANWASRMWAGTSMKCRIERWFCNPSLLPLELTNSHEERLCLCRSPLPWPLVQSARPHSGWSVPQPPLSAGWGGPMPPLQPVFYAWNNHAMKPAPSVLDSWHCSQDSCPVSAPSTPLQRVLL